MEQERTSCSLVNWVVPHFCQKQRLSEKSVDKVRTLLRHADKRLELCRVNYLASILSSKLALLTTD